MDEQFFLDNIDNRKKLPGEAIAKGILDGKVTFEKLRATLKFDKSTQDAVRLILDEKDSEMFYSAADKFHFQNYVKAFPKGKHIKEANSRIAEINRIEEERRKREIEREKLLNDILLDVNGHTPDEVISKLDDLALNELCNTLNINIDILKGYNTPELLFNDIPESEAQIPQGYTDVFFWGIPSSGKTCALSAILSTMKMKYSIEAPDCPIKFGATYRDSLTNIFQNGIGYLPERTNTDRTQYMPFILYKRGERKRRKLSFFELSGEVFRHFYEKTNNVKIIKNEDRGQIESSFKSLNVLLNSRNQKIHIFFIDYDLHSKYMKDEENLTQNNYLEAAATYFRDNMNILQERTDSVFVVVTKSDRIHGDSKQSVASNFLQNHFGSFMDVLSNQCARYSINFKVKIFSIGDVYFKRICKIDHSFSDDIIKDLLEKVRPVSENNFISIFNR